MKKHPKLFTKLKLNPEFKKENIKIKKINTEN